MSILSSTDTGLYNMPLNDKTLKMMGYQVTPLYSGNSGFYLKHKIAVHNEFICNLQNYYDEDRWFTIIHQKLSTSLAQKMSTTLNPESKNGGYYFKIYFETTGKLKEFEKYFRIKDNPSYTDEQKEQLLYYFFERGYKFFFI